MIEEQAIVIDVDNEIATLEIVRKTACGLCGQTRGCGMSVWGRLLGHRSRVFKAVNQVNAQVGDTVVVGIEEGAVLASSMTIYGLPLATMLAGALLSGLLPADSVSQRDAYALMGAVTGFVMGLFWMKAHIAGRAGQNLNGRYQPVILRAGDSSGMTMKCERGM